MIAESFLQGTAQRLRDLETKNLVREGFVINLEKDHSEKEKKLNGFLITTSTTVNTVATVS